MNKLLAARRILIDYNSYYFFNRYKGEKGEPGLVGPKGIAGKLALSNIPCFLIACLMYRYDIMQQ